ncbi:hypothetical protein CDD83_11139 [Cordyceps sp. RAO-2017]|nr:hypothetical protein CDD83_11139 [Cordyceps sp. RAO-2017]
MLFLGHASSKFNDSNQTNVPIYGLGDDDRKPLWQEVIHKAKVRLCRSAQHQIPNSSTGDERPTDLVTACEIPEYSYYLEIIEDFNDGRVHEDLELQSLRCGVRRASIRETIPVYQISKIFYADTGRILNIGKAEDGENSPVLLLKRDLEANRSFAKGTDACGSIKKATEEDQENAAAVEEDFFDEQACIDQQLQEESAHTASASLKNRLDAVGGGSRLPKHFDPEWIAFEVYEDDETVDDSETEGESDSDAEELEGGEQMHGATPAAEAASPDVELAAQLRSLSLQPPPEPGAVRDVASSFSAQTPEVDEAGALDFVARSPFKNVTTSLSLIEMLIRLAGLQEFQQVSHLSIPDHILTFFLEETSTTGLTGEARRTVRSEAKRHVGFDPYTDTPTE